MSQTNIFSGVRKNFRVVAGMLTRGIVGGIAGGLSGGLCRKFLGGNVCEGAMSGAVAGAVAGATSAIPCDSSMVANKIIAAIGIGSIAGAGTEMHRFNGYGIRDLDPILMTPFTSSIVALGTLYMGGAAARLMARPIGKPSNHATRTNFQV